MFQGLRTVIYPVSDLEKAKAWYGQVLKSRPMFDKPFYVGFNVGGFELGLDPDDLGSPMGAAVASFALFSVGAIVPVVPFLITTGTPAMASAGLLALLVLAGVGGFVGFLSGTSITRSAFRMAGLAALAAAVTWAVGRAFGATLT